jgi:hypothetical protein
LLSETRARDAAILREPVRCCCWADKAASRADAAFCDAVAATGTISAAANAFSSTAALALAIFSVTRVDQ